MYLENIVGIEKYDCTKKKGTGCNGCGNCQDSSNKKQEDFYFLFYTLSVRSSIRPNFHNTPENIDENLESIDFLFKFIGYDNNLLIMADLANAQRKPKILTYDDIFEIIVITERTKPVYTLVGDLKRIHMVMSNNIKIKVRDEYIQQFMYWDEKLQDANFEEIKCRFKCICDISWYNFNCYNFAEVFRYLL